MWTFRELQIGEPERTPHEAEFFRLSHPSEAIVREFIQNSLDARARENTKVRVRFVLGTVSRNTLDRFLGKDFEKHMKAAGLFPAEYQTLNSFSFLTIEDFGTTGLDGETGESARPEGRHNFYNFWWCEGKTLKRGHDAGRWGLGKTTFHVASKLRAFWGFTVRSDDRRKLLLGKVLLKAHRFNGRTYEYYGYYVQEGFTPIDSDQAIQHFKSTFSISRAEEDGFSLVIPMPESEIDIPSITRSVILHYFYAIMSGLLDVEITGLGERVRLDSVNLVEKVADQDWQGTVWEDFNVGVFLNFIKTCIENEAFFLLPQKSGEHLQIDETSFGENLDRLRENFADMGLIAIRIPIAVQGIGRTVTHSFFGSSPK